MLFGGLVESGTVFTLSQALTPWSSSPPTGPVVVVVHIASQFSAGATMAVSDGTNSYTAQVTNQQVGQSSAVYIFTFTYTSPPSSLTVTATATTSNIQHMAALWVNSPGVTGTPVGNSAFQNFPGTGANIQNSGTVTPGVNNSYLLGFASTNTGGGLSIGTGYTTLGLTDNTTFGEYLQQTTATAQAATFGNTNNASDFSSVIALQSPPLARRLTPNLPIPLSTWEMQQRLRYRLRLAPVP